MHGLGHFGGAAIKLTRVVLAAGTGVMQARKLPDFAKTDVGRVELSNRQAVTLVDGTDSPFLKSFLNVYPLGGKLLLQERDIWLTLTFKTVYKGRYIGGVVLLIVAYQWTDSQVKRSEILSQLKLSEKIVKFFWWLQRLKMGYINVQCFQWYFKGHIVNVIHAWNIAESTSVQPVAVPIECGLHFVLKV
jgi:hypothetical protein